MKNWDEFDQIVKSSMSEEEYERHILISKISADLIRLRLEQNMTQTDLAEKSGLKQSATARLESEEVLPKLSTLLKLTKALDANINLNPNQESIIKIESNKMINNKAD
ncbi:helix-turn-helix domain-containing protein [Halanaerobium congolense]|jgi:transcriptional regulator with XRE-family HTH domain|uniref:Xre family transcriptional regulator n=1 Tax=Halanaerobium congolense TaxID=54121 RepID=A0A318E4Z4_9FIRM|nr:helix-turn-helix transcriptional regulator [Halanaerobium congolense]PXV62944.1 Xre family transcriptional regulator [Halanaerobium congolense]TDP26773.1 Xre family transcriptional regulator [Halanaerobium congolense]TDX42258.1 Xre family transcriptional regulator [Halanaerobium congolense]SDH75267.1 Helix-turn-helix [Halanaerobium congolense]